MRINKKYSLEVIEVGDKLLKTSCRKAIERSGDTDGAYKTVKCSFNSPKKFFDSIKYNNKKLYYNWLELTKIYLDNGKARSFRPTFDRINSQGHYYINNIQILTYGKNSSKARKKHR